MTPLQEVLQIEYVEALRQDQWEYVKTLLEGIEDATIHPPVQGKKASRFLKRRRRANREEISKAVSVADIWPSSLLENQVSQVGTGLETIATLECHPDRSPALLDTANPFYAFPSTASVGQCVAMLHPGIYGVARNDKGRLLFQVPRYMAQRQRVSW